MNILMAALLWVASAGFCFAQGQSTPRGDDPRPEHVVSNKAYSSIKYGRFHVIVRNDGHVLAKPYIVEVRPVCGAAQIHWRELSVADMVSACRLGKNPVLYKSGTEEVWISYYDTDADRYNRESKINPHKVFPPCSKWPGVLKVRLSGICPTL